jgi:Fe-Mn family superoxide dismutase
MFGPGFVWLAKNLDRKGMIQIICTYNAGSPYPAAHARRQSVDMATNASLGNQYAGSMGSLSANTKELAPGALDLEPILCVNTWEHVWMMDYGVGGKAEYLERWWNRINWEVVLENYNAASTLRGNRTAGDWRRTI